MGPANPAKAFFWHHLVKPKFEEAVSNGAALLKVMEEMLVMVDLPEPSENMQSPTPNVVKNTEAEWIVFVKAELSDAQVQDLCSLNKKGCNIRGHPTGSASFLEVSAMEAETLTDLLQSHGGTFALSRLFGSSPGAQGARIDRHRVGVPRNKVHR